MTISTQIIEVLDDLGRRFGLAIDWSQEKILPYLEELAGKFIAWEIATSKAWLYLGCILVAVGIVLYVCDVWKDWDGLGAFTGCVVALCGGAIVFCQVMDILTCIHFPEKQIIEYVNELMRSKT